MDYTGRTLLSTPLPIHELQTEGVTAVIRDHSLGVTPSHHHVLQHHDIQPPEHNFTYSSPQVIHGREETKDTRYQPYHEPNDEGMIELQLGIYGGKKVAFYLLVFLITIVVLINSALIVWIMTVINFSPVNLYKIYIIILSVVINVRSSIN